MLSTSDRLTIAALLLASLAALTACTTDEETGKAASKSSASTSTKAGRDNGKASPSAPTKGSEGTGSSGGSKGTTDGSSNGAPGPDEYSDGDGYGNGAPGPDEYSDGDGYGQHAMLCDKQKLKASLDGLSEAGTRGKGRFMVENTSSKDCVLPKVLDATFGAAGNDLPVKSTTDAAQAPITLKPHATATALLWYTVDASKPSLESAQLNFDEFGYLAVEKWGEAIYMGGTTAKVGAFTS
ncbi:DUF4232 domain-containing protein [Streptomyces sp. NBC_00289]|uniref:DUF4232 domain-containing protein n=1 Tax=Streptomyces sp. NBC_00289 TaxID=2975703 RepID=UPI0032472E15